MEGDIGRHGEAVEAALYFCVAEAMQNTAKHAQAASVRVRIGDAEGHVTATVVDDGVGFDSQTAQSGSGAANLRDRIEPLGGRVDVTSRPGGGCTVTLRVPV